MADKTTVRLLFVISAAFDINIAHIDIKEACRHETSDHSGIEQAYIHQRPRFDGTFTHEPETGRLNKSIYGTPGAGHSYLKATFQLLKKHRFNQSEAYMCPFAEKEWTT